MIAHRKTARTLTALFLAAALWSGACAAPAGAGRRPAAETQKQKKKKAPDEKNPQYQYEMGVIALRYGLPDEAIRYGKLAVSLDPGHFDGWKLLGLAYSDKADFALCAEAYEKAAAIKPGAADVQRGLGLAYVELKETEKAETALKRSFDDRRRVRDGLLYRQVLLQRGPFRGGPGLHAQVHPEERQERRGLQPQGRHPEPARPLRGGRRKLPGGSRSRARGRQPAGQPGHRLAQQRRAGQGAGRVRGGPAQDRAGGAEEARRGLHQGHQGRREVGPGKRRSSPRRKASPFSTKARPSGQRSWKMPRSKAKSPSRVL